MKTLKEAKIERFGHQDRYKNILTYFHITYIWEYKILGITFHNEENVPILFEFEQDAIDFIECGCNVEMKIGQNSYGENLYDFYAYKINDPDKKYKIRVNGIDDPDKKYKIQVNGQIDGYESLFVVNGYEQEKTWVSSSGGKISDFFEKLKQHEDFVAQQNEKERKNKEYINSLYEVKTYKIEKIEK